MALNTAVNLLALLLTMRVLGIRRVWWRVVLAALVGALWAVMGEVMGVLVWGQVAAPICMTAVAFPGLFVRGDVGKSGLRWARAVAVLYGTAFVMAGAVMAAANWWQRVQASEKGWLVRVPVWMVVGGCVLGAGVAVAMYWWHKTRPRVFELQFEVNGQVCTAMAMVDTGNMLREPLSGLPVAVMALEKADFLPDGWRETICRLLDNGDADIPDMPIRWVPFHSAGGAGLMPAVPAQLLPNRTPFLLAFSLQPLQYMLLPADLVNGK